MGLTYHKYSVTRGVYKVKTRAAIALAAVGLALGGGGGLSLATFGTVHATPPATIYNNFPSP